ncbi:MAG: SMI1/KNR4 family protein [Kofleriaceae bacterium]
MSDLAAGGLAETTRAALAALAEGDRALRRFGAAHHRYALAPPSSASAIEAIERRIGPLPDDLRTFALEVGAGGAGPYYGWLPLERAAELVYDAPPGIERWRRALPVAHVGCGYAAVVPLDGDARGELWLDARALGQVHPIAPSFTAFYVGWIDRLARGRWPDDLVPPGACALASALGGYLGVCEQRLGIEPGTLAGPALREALDALGPGAIASAAEGPLPLFEPGDRVDPCLACARLVDHLAADGLRRDAVAPGLPPLPLRGPRSEGSG